MGLNSPENNPAVVQSVMLSIFRISTVRSLLFYELFLQGGPMYSDLAFS